jgi:hypothetical protein
MNKTEQLREENQSRRLSSKSGVPGSNPGEPTKIKGVTASAMAPSLPFIEGRGWLNAGKALATGGAL